MTKSLLTYVVLLAMAPVHAFAQPAVFFDDFDGDALLPHWNVPAPTDWEYNVSNSMLNVTGLFSPSHPKSPSNFAAIGTLFQSQSDFRVDAWMGWEFGPQPHRLVLEINSGPNGTGILAQFGYRYDGTFGANPLIFASASGEASSAQAPTPGIHQFTIIRYGTLVEFMLNGNSFASFSGTSGAAATGISFFFLGPYPGDLGAFHIDRIQVVPGPGVAMFILAFSLYSSTRKRF